MPKDLAPGERLPYMVPARANAPNPFVGPRATVTYPFAEPPPPSEARTLDPMVSSPGRPPLNIQPTYRPVPASLPSDIPPGISNPGPRYTQPKAPSALPPRLPAPAPKPAGPDLGEVAKTVGKGIAGRLPVIGPIIKGADTAATVASVARREIGMLDDSLAGGYDPEKVKALRRKRAQRGEKLYPFEEPGKMHDPFKNSGIPDPRVTPPLPQWLEPLPKKKDFPAGTLFSVRFLTPGAIDSEGFDSTFTWLEVTDADYNPKDVGYLARTFTTSGVDVSRGAITATSAGYYSEVPIRITVRAKPPNEPVSDPIPYEQLQPQSVPASVPIDYEIPVFPAFDYPPEAPLLPRPIDDPQPVPEPDNPTNPEPKKIPVPVPVPSTTPGGAPGVTPGGAPGVTPGGSPGGAPTVIPGGSPSPAPSPDGKPTPRSSPYPQINPTQNPYPKTPETPTPTPEPIPEPAPPPPVNPPITVECEGGKGQDCAMRTASALQFATVHNCDEEGKPQRVTVPQPVAEIMQFQAEQIKKLGELLCGLDVIASVPEWWQIRVGNRPQLVVNYAEQLKTGKLGRSHWHMTIPHYNKPKTYKPTFPTYTRGDIEGILTLTDNSKIIVNCSTATEAKRVINALKKYIPANLLKGANLKVGERVNSGYKKIKVVATSAKFFSKGQENMIPDWTIKLR